MEYNSYCREVMEDYSHWFPYFPGEFKTKLILIWSTIIIIILKANLELTNHVPIRQRNLETVFSGSEVSLFMYNVQLAF